jgi:alkylation response protein AidB-like acyl-CoA dehydrogenase
MVIRIFAVESMIYRSAGLMDRAIAAAGENADKSQQSMKVYEEYAIESSISKVYGSELLDFVVDEAVQIFGGYGFHEDYPVARSYRDSRVNRIFEGTNEINRMLIIQMLMKRATSGVLPLMQAGAKLRDEIMAGPSFDEPETSAWAEEEKILAGIKKAFLLVAGAALEKYRERLADQQEIVAALSEIVMECYAAESSLRRVQKAEAARGAALTSVMADAARVFLHDAADRVEIGARKALAAVLDGDMLRTQLAVLRRFMKREPVDTLAMCQRVSAAVQANDRYPFEGR